MRSQAVLSMSIVSLALLSACNDEPIDIVVDRGQQGLSATDELQTSNGVSIDTVINQPKSAVPTWIVGPPMAIGRYEHTMTECPNGKILVTGGFIVGATTTNTAEIYDPQAMTWASAGTMSAPRARHSATLMSNGKVLVVGGFPGNDGSYGSEIYDCTTNTWTAMPLPPPQPMNQPRMYQAGITLPNGMVLVGSGCCNAAYGTAEFYDPSTGKWTSTPLLAMSHAGPTLTFLPTKNNYESLLVGNGANPTTELYDYKTNLWKTTGPLNSPRNSHSATWMPSIGKVVVAGGIAVGGPAKLTEVYDPATEIWTAGKLLAVDRYNHTATLISEGGVEDIVWAGGSPAADASCETYGGKTCPNLNFGRTLHRALAVPHLGKAKVMVTGGVNSGTGASLNTVEFLDLNPLSILGDPCTLATECASGFCADGVCCNAACNAGACDSCSTGTCELLTGPVCDDGNACTQMDSCNAGTCVGANPVSCSALDECHEVGMCNSQTGICSDPTAPDGTACEGGSCQKGICQLDSSSSSSSSSGGGMGGAGGGSGGNGGTAGASSTSSTSSSSGGDAGAGGKGGPGGAGGAAGGGGDGESGGSGGGQVGDDSGCGCVVVGDARGPGSAIGIVMALAALGRRRRR